MTKVGDLIRIDGFEALFIVEQIWDTGLKARVYGYKKDKPFARQYVWKTIDFSNWQNHIS